ncbi:hypothetical protein [Veillonella sp.]|jgi:hypothetical protein|uniref:hypothetical protein n=1 Tax=Veillonella sp. TaxID=1926307 RepID=UPI002900E698|nr:hypothetical protein [Veillonella sp.]MDU2302146.1 hypothetical protein [Veillonella sp.]MDU2388944.1 hypothetical protein [Veillonella sp.]
MTHSRNYRTLRRLILPALAGGALAALAFAPTFGAEPVQANVPTQSISAPKGDAPKADVPKTDVPKADVPRPDDVKTGEINEPTPHKEANPSTFTGTSVISESKTFEHQRFDNTTSDQNSFIGKNKASITINSSVFDKTGNTTNDDNSNFRGQNAVVLGIEGSQTSIKDSNITSNSIGSNAVFATGEGSVINVENTNIHTKGDSSRGLDATYKGTVNGKNLTITTEGAHSATLATDRGEGTITAEAAKLTTSGTGSPVIYSTGNITANNVNGVANKSEIGVVEGKNSITLTNSNVTGYHDNGFMLYQSFSGDAESGIARLKAENNTLTTHGTGAFIYVNNTTAEADLTGNTILMPNTTTLVKAAADSRWGKDGENGGHLTLRASNQALNGNILADAISTVALDMTNGSSLVGAINTDNTAKEVTVKISKDSSWTLTGDSYVESLTNKDTTGSNIHLNGYKLVVADK